MESCTWPVCHYDTVDNRIEIVSAKGCYLHTSEGEKLFDATSSWWCKLLGHVNGELLFAMQKQMSQLNHVMSGGVKTPVVEKLSRRLVELNDDMAQCFYASDGSCAIEIAMKLSLHARQIENQTHRNQFAVLKGSYHGETLGALSLTTAGSYKSGYESILANPVEVDLNDLESSLSQLENSKECITAIVIEPLVQGANSMNMYSAKKLNRICQKAHELGIHIIMDEIMTGLARAGAMLASDVVTVPIDMICLGKNVTAGVLPMSVCMLSKGLSNAMQNSTKPFLHSHTYSAHALAASVANKVLDIIERDDLCNRAMAIGEKIKNVFREYKPRQLGAIVAYDFNSNEKARAHCQQWLKKGYLLRPIGKTVYWMPPLVMDLESM